jgi:hypothetical protein
MLGVIVPPQGKELGRQHDKSILLPFASPNVYDPCTVDIGASQLAQLRDAGPCGIECCENDTLLQILWGMQ